MWVPEPIRDVRCAVVEYDATRCGERCQVTCSAIPCAVVLSKLHHGAVRCQTPICLPWSQGVSPGVSPPALGTPRGYPPPATGGSGPGPPFGGTGPGGPWATPRSRTPLRGVLAGPPRGTPPGYPRGVYPPPPDPDRPVMRLADHVRVFRFESQESRQAREGKAQVDVPCAVIRATLVISHAE